MSAIFAAWAWFTGTTVGRACLMAAVAVLAALGIYRRGKTAGEAETESDIREEAADARDRIDAVPEPGRGDVDRRLRDGEF